MKIQLNSIYEYLKKDWKLNLLISVIIVGIVTIVSLIIPIKYKNLLGMEVNYTRKVEDEEQRKVFEWEASEKIKNYINNQNTHVTATNEVSTNIVTIHNDGLSSTVNRAELKSEYKNLQKKLKNKNINLKLVNDQTIQTPKISQNLVISILIIGMFITLRFLIKFN